MTEKWKQRYSKREEEKKSLYENKENIITEKVGIKRNLQKNNKEEYLYNTNHHINKIEKKHWSNYYKNNNQIYYHHYSKIIHKNDIIISCRMMEK